MMVSVTLLPWLQPLQNKLFFKKLWDKGPTPAPQVGLDKPPSAQAGSPAEP